MHFKIIWSNFTVQTVQEGVDSKWYRLGKQNKGRRCHGLKSKLWYKATDAVTHPSAVKYSKLSSEQALLNPSPPSLGLFIRKSERCGISVPVLLHILTLVGLSCRSPGHDYVLLATTGVGLINQDLSGADLRVVTQAPTSTSSLLGLDAPKTTRLLGGNSHSRSCDAQHINHTHLHKHVRTHNYHMLQPNLYNRCHISETTNQTAFISQASALLHSCRPLCCQGTF